MACVLLRSSPRFVATDYLSSIHRFRLMVARPSPTNGNELVEVHVILCPFTTGTYELLSVSEVPGTLGLSSCPFAHPLVNYRLSAA